MAKGMQLRATKAAGWVAAILAAGAISAAAQTVPPVVVSSTTTIAASGTSSVGKVVQDACGDLYELETGGSLFEIPAGGGAAQQVSLPPNGLASTGSYGIAIDNSDNLYVGGMDGYYSGGHLWKIPLNSSCVPQVSSATDLYSTIGSLGAISYYSAPNGVAVDSSGDIFLSINISCCTTTQNWIVEITSAGAAAQVVSNYGSVITSMAADSSGNVFFTASGSGDVYEVAAGSYNSASGGTPTPVISSGLQTALGLAIDGAGDLYVGDSGSGSLYEVPMAEASGSTTAALQFGSMYRVASQLALGSPLTLSRDGKSFFFGDSNPNVYQLAVGSANLGSLAVGSSGTAAIGVTFNASVTPASISLFPSGGQFSMSGGSSPCSAGTAYTAGQSCSESLTFSPAFPGVAEAGISLLDSSNASLATFYASGTGTGSGITVDPGVPVAVAASFQSPQAVAVDGAGDVFYADPGMNSVLEVAPGSSTGVAVGSGLSEPAGVAVDGAGNLLIADTGNNRIVEVPMVNGALSTSAQIALPTTLAGEALSGPTGLAVDSGGDLYIADTGNNRIVAVPYSAGWNFSAASVVASGLDGPLAVAAGPSGNLYVANSGAGQIYKILSPLTQPTSELVAVGFGKPAGLAVDASGSLFVADPTNGELVRIPNLSGNLDANEAVQAGIGIGAPYGVAIDPAGNLYVSDSSAGAAYVISRTGTTLDFGSWVVGATSGPFSAQVEDEGNLPLNLKSPWYSATGNTGDFSVAGSGAGSCASGGQVAVGDSCELDATFTPAAAGGRSEVLTLASDATNASPVQVTLSGTGSTAATTTTQLAITSPTSGAPFFGQPITFAATVSAASGTPTGSVTLFVDGVQTATTALGSGGTASFTLGSGLTGGNHSALAIYQGSTGFSGSVSQDLEISVTKAPTTTALSVDTPYTAPPSAVAGDTVTLTAAIQSTGVGIPTGTVTFDDNGKALGTAPVLPSATGGYSATLSTTALSTGSNVLAAAYSGDANYIASTSASEKVTVVSSAEVTFATSGTSLKSGTGSASSITISATSYGGWTGLVAFGCLQSSLPANATCVFSPGQLQIMASTAAAPAQNPPVTLSVAINQPPQTPTASGMLWWLAGPMGLLLLVTRRRFARYLSASVLTIVALLLLGISGLGLGACGSSPQNITPSGTSTITVYAYADPFTAPPSSSTPTPPTQACPGGDSSAAPCSEQTFQVSLTVQ